MTDATENLILEHLKRFHAGQERIERRLEEIVQRIGHVEMSLASLRKTSPTPRRQAPPVRSVRSHE